MGGPPVPEQVLAAARRHLDAAPRLRGARWVLDPLRQVPGGWFFAYRIERHPPSRKPPPPFGYFPGYIVAEDGSSARNVDERWLRELVESGVLA